MNQPTLFDLQAFTKDSFPTPVHDPYWDEIEIAPELVQCVREQLPSIQAIDFTTAQNHNDCVREQQITEVKSAPEQSTLGTELEPAPEHTHWIEKYWVKRRENKYNYYRYCWMSGRKIHHCHISGGSTESVLAIQRREAVEIAISDGQSPREIEKLIQFWRGQLSQERCAFRPASRSHF